MFADIRHHIDAEAGSDYWEVRSKDGLSTYYGTNPEDAPAYSQSPGPYSDNAVITKERQSPTDRSRIFAWKITLTKDPFGNRIEYLYEARDKPTGNEPWPGHSWDQPLLTQIRYVDYALGAARAFLSRAS